MSDLSAASAVCELVALAPELVSYTSYRYCGLRNVTRETI